MTRAPPARIDIAGDSGATSTPASAPGAAVKLAGLKPVTVTVSRVRVAVSTYFAVAVRPCAVAAAVGVIVASRTRPAFSLTGPFVGSEVGLSMPQPAPNATNAITERIAVDLRMMTSPDHDEAAERRS